MRFLLVNDHCISDPTAGVTQSLRTIMRWLGDAGHTCHVLTTARFEAPVSFTIEEHLAQHGVAAPGAAAARTKRKDRPVVHYSVAGVPITLLLTRHNDQRRPDRSESRQYQQLCRRLLDEIQPDVVIGCNGRSVIFEALAEARARGAATAFAVRGYGYYDRRFFEHVDHVFTCSEFLTNFYREKTGLHSTALEPPIDWSTVVAPEESRAFVTFVHPAPHKGVLLFARLAAMLGARRPDIPVLVIQSGRTAGALNGIPGIDFRPYPQIMAAPAVATPSEYFALTRILLVPSVWHEPFGRVAAEAMINGIPPLVSDRGALPDVIRASDGSRLGGRVLPVPAWMTEVTLDVPDEQDVKAWYDAVCELWDNQEQYQSLARDARRIAEDRYSEAVSREKHVDYFTNLTPGTSPYLAQDH